MPFVISAHCPPFKINTLQLSKYNIVTLFPQTHKNVKYLRIQVYFFTNFTLHIFNSISILHTLHTIYLRKYSQYFHDLPFLISHLT